MAADDMTLVNPNFKAVGFKSFPDHWMDVRNEPVWQDRALDDLRVKKIIMFRQDELAVFVSTKRGEMTGHYLTHSYPKDLKLRIDVAEFQTFVDHYRDTFRRKYRPPIEKRDTFHIAYEQLLDEDRFESFILPKLWDLLGVDNTGSRNSGRRPSKRTRTKISRRRSLKTMTSSSFAFVTRMFFILSKTRRRMNKLVTGELLKRVHYARKRKQPPDPPESTAHRPKETDSENLATG
jgi:hypothetical protein